MVTGIEWLGIGLGTGGLIASIAGVVFAFSARRAAKSAEQAAKDAHGAVTRSLSLVDVERAVALINRLKEIHRRGNWEYALGLYQELRRTLSEIVASIPGDWSNSRGEIRDAIPQLTALENLVSRSLYESESGGPEDIPKLDETLSHIQQSLESLQSQIIYEKEAMDS